MFPQNMSRPEFYPDDLSTDPTSILEQHLLAGFPPDLALDLVLNELVVRAAEATRATAAALALSRGDEMVCRAATGPLAPDLGVPLNNRDGLSGACLQTRQPQLSVDTEFDPRIDPVISRRLGIRSILIVPIFDAGDRTQFTGILEVFSSSPAAFSHRDQKSLEGFADECARIRQFATELRQRKPILSASPQFDGPKFDSPEILPAEFHFEESDPADFVVPVPPVQRPAHDAWALVLGALTILAAVAISFLIGSRIGWLNPVGPAVNRQISQPDPVSIPVASRKAAPTKPVGLRATASTKPVAAPNPDELVVYERGKVVFRSNSSTKREPAKNAPGNPDSVPTNAIVTASSTTKREPAKNAQANPASIPTEAIVAASSTKRIAKRTGVWLSADEAEDRLVNRIEPEYPLDALTSHRSGNVVLELLVSEDGSVARIHTVSGDPLLAAAATEAIRSWRYQPYRQHDRPSQFQTDVTMTFTLPN